MAELCLGTAQLGMKYGINNKVGKLDREAVFEILDTAIKGGIELIDTASVYGEAEELLGEYISNNMDIANDILIISKPNGSIKGLNTTEIENAIRLDLEQSLSRLRRDFLDGYLVHSYRGVDRPEIIEILYKLKEEGLIKKIGMSVYDTDEASKAIERNIDYLQMPCSVFDQRGLSRGGLFRKAKEKGIIVFTRSVFLQGLLMMKENEIPGYLQGLVPYIKQFNDVLSKYNVNKKHALIKFILSEQLIDYMVFGVETKSQLNEILEERHSPSLPEALLEELKDKFNNLPIELILPVHWQKK